MCWDFTKLFKEYLNYEEKYIGRVVLERRCKERATCVRSGVVARWCTEVQLKMLLYIMS
jgi:hypothetical protein